MQIGREFYNIVNMRGVIGNIDGTYVKIAAPQCKNLQVYVNCRCCNGVTLQAVCT